MYTSSFKSIELSAKNETFCVQSVSFDSIRHSRSLRCTNATKRIRFVILFNLTVPHSSNPLGTLKEFTHRD